MQNTPTNSLDINKIFININKIINNIVYDEGEISPKVGFTLIKKRKQTIYITDPQYYAKRIK